MREADTLTPPLRPDATALSRVTGATSDASDVVASGLSAHFSAKVMRNVSFSQALTASHISVVWIVHGQVCNLITTSFGELSISVKIQFSRLAQGRTCVGLPHSREHSILFSALWRREVGLFRRFFGVVWLKHAAAPSRPHARAAVKCTPNRH